MGHIDADDINEDGETNPPTGDKASRRAPGSLMSVKIRKRATGSQLSVGQAASNQAVAPDTTESPSAVTPAAPITSETSENSIKEQPSSVAQDRISRIARRAQSERAARPAAAPQRSVVRSPLDQLPVQEPPVEQPHSWETDHEAAPPAQTHDIVAYWTRLRGGRRFPKSSDIDTATISEYWPNSILIRCRPGSRALEPHKQFLAGEGASAAGLSGLSGSRRVNLSPMMLQWLLGLAGEVVRECRPMNDVETFPSVNRVAHYRAVALPFSDNENAVDHVLCHVNSGK